MTSVGHFDIVLESIRNRQRLTRYIFFERRLSTFSGSSSSLVEMVDIDVFTFNYLDLHTERYRTTLYALHLHSLSTLVAFLTCRALILSAQLRLQVLV